MEAAVRRRASQIPGSWTQHERYQSRRGTTSSNPVRSSEESCERWSPLRRSSATRSPRRTYFGSMVQRGLITCAYCRCERALSKWGVTSGPPDVSQYGWSPPITVTGWAIAGAPLLLALGFAASWVISGFKREVSASQHAQRNQRRHQGRGSQLI